MESLTFLERLVEQDYGLEIDGTAYAHAIQHDSLVINRRKQLFFWNSKNINGDAFTYLTVIRGLNANNANELIRKNGQAHTYITEIRNEEEVVVYPKLVEVFKENLAHADKTYFYKRTINDETMSRFDLGFNDGYYMIPFRQDYVLKQFQMRRDYPSKDIRGYYKNAGGFLYNSDYLPLINKVYYVEGVTSCLVLMQNGIPSVSSNTGAEGFMHRWFGKFLHQDEIYLIYDNDSAGRLGAIRTAKILGENRCKIYTFDGQEKGYDANDFFIDGGTKDQFIDLVNEKSKYSFELEREGKGGRLRFR
jgi:DNA primase